MTWAKSFLSKVFVEISVKSFLWRVFCGDFCQKFSMEVCCQEFSARRFLSAPKVLASSSLGLVQPQGKRNKTPNAESVG